MDRQTSEYQLVKRKAEKILGNSGVEKFENMSATYYEKVKPSQILDLLLHEKKNKESLLEMKKIKKRITILARKNINLQKYYLILMEQQKTERTYEIPITSLTKMINSISQFQIKEEPQEKVDIRPKSQTKTVKILYHSDSKIQTSIEINNSLSVLKKTLAQEKQGGRDIQKTEKIDNKQSLKIEEKTQSSQGKQLQMDVSEEFAQLETKTMDERLDEIQEEIVKAAKQRERELEMQGDQNQSAHLEKLLIKNEQIVLYRFQFQNYDTRKSVCQRLKKISEENENSSLREWASKAKAQLPATQPVVQIQDYKIEKIKLVYEKISNLKNFEDEAEKFAISYSYLRNRVHKVLDELLDFDGNRLRIVEFFEQASKEQALYIRHQQFYAVILKTIAQKSKYSALLMGKLEKIPANPSPQHYEMFWKNFCHKYIELVETFSTLDLQAQQKIIRFYENGTKKKGLEEKQKSWFKYHLPTLISLHQQSLKNKKKSRSNMARSWITGWFSKSEKTDLSKPLLTQKNQ